MAGCRGVRPILPRVVEGDASPAESLRAARHLPGCTACRILLSREQHLARLLAVMDDRLPVGVEFAASVMGALPEGPPPAPAGPLLDRGRRRLRIVGPAGAIVLGLGLAWRFAPPGVAGGPFPGLPRFELEGMGSLAEAFARLLFVALARLSAGLRPELPGWSAGPGVEGFGLAVSVLAALMLSTGVALATGGLQAQGIPRAIMRFLSVVGERPRRLAAAGKSPRSSASTRRM